MKAMLKIICLLFPAVFSLSANAALPEKFFEVSPGIYRSAQPSTDDLQDLKNAGIKTILDFNGDSETMAAEREAATALGINFIARPMSGFWKPKDEQVDGSLEVLRDASNYPILVHCKHGEDRTGLIIGLHRVFAENWEPGAAYSEMLEHGFHKSLVFLNHYFEKRTGFED